MDLLKNQEYKKNASIKLINFKANMKKKYLEPNKYNLNQIKN